MPDGRGGMKEYACAANHELVVAGENVVRFKETIGFTDTDKATFTFPSGTGEFAITGMKTLVEDAIANRSDILSVIIRFDAEGEDDGNDDYRWRSSEYGTEAERWRLVVEYTEAQTTGDPQNFRRQVII